MFLRMRDSRKLENETKKWKYIVMVSGTCLCLILIPLCSLVQLKTVAFLFFTLELFTLLADNIMRQNKIVSWIWNSRQCWILKCVMFWLGPATDNGKMVSEGNKGAQLFLFVCLLTTCLFVCLNYIKSIMKTSINLSGDAAEEGNYSFFNSVKSLMLWESYNKINAPPVVLATSINEWWGNTSIINYVYLKKLFLIFEVVYCYTS